MSRFMNFIRAGVLKNRSRTTMVVPTGQPAASQDRSLPPSKDRWEPSRSSRVRVSSSTRLTAAVAARASPRKPRVPMAARSSWVRSLEVAWRRKAVRASSRLMPQPSSLTRRKLMPPFCSSTVTVLAPASMAFSTSSFTTEAGRSTTSPAAIRLARWGSSWMILGMIGSPPVLV